MMGGEFSPLPPPKKEIKMAGEEDTMDRAIYSAMKGGEPYKRYIKTILGMVFVTVLNPFSGKPEGVNLKGEPDGANTDTFVEIWSPKEDIFFQRMNAGHFNAGNLRLLSESLPEVPRSPNDITNDEIDELLGKKFLALKNKLNQFTAPGPVYRLLRRAEELEKSEKIIAAIKARLAELELSIVPKPQE